MNLRDDLDLYTAMSKTPEGIFALKPEAVVDLRRHIEGYHLHLLPPPEGVQASAVSTSLGHRSGPQPE